MRRHDTTDLASALGVGRGDLVSLVGGGGKTTTMARLTTDLRARGLLAAAATTTKIAAPAPSDPLRLLCVETLGVAVASLASWPMEGPPPVLGARVLPSGKVEGIPPQWCDRLLADARLDALVVEADGAARRPIKAPERWEPVVPLSTTVFVPILGLSCAGRNLDDTVAFRPEKISAVTGVRAGTPLGPDALASLLVSGEGLLKGRPATARAIAFLNQADLPGAWEVGSAVAELVLGKSAAFIRVVVASVREPGQGIVVWTR